MAVKSWQSISGDTILRHVEDDSRNAGSHGMSVSQSSMPPEATRHQSLPARIGYFESDNDFLCRQFHLSVNALERAHALSPGEFEHLVTVPVHSDTEREHRTAHHEDIARRALIAVQQCQLVEEEFNVWSGRRKENGEPVKLRFERAFANAGTPKLNCMRGALTGIVRAYLRLQDEMITTLIARAEAASTSLELLDLEYEACQKGVIEFERYVSAQVAGWPCYPRSTGRFRGATRLRGLLESRQNDLPLPQDLLDDITDWLASETQSSRILSPLSGEQASRQQESTSMLRRLIYRFFGQENPRMQG